MIIHLWCAWMCLGTFGHRQIIYFSMLGGPDIRKDRCNSNCNWNRRLLSYPNIRQTLRGYAHTHTHTHSWQLNSFHQGVWSRLQLQSLASYLLVLHDRLVRTQVGHSWVIRSCPSIFFSKCCEVSLQEKDRHLWFWFKHHSPSNKALNKALNKAYHLATAVASACYPRLYPRRWCDHALWSKDRADKSCSVLQPPCAWAGPQRKKNGPITYLRSCIQWLNWHET